jgi:hypothetical protein
LRSAWVVTQSKSAVVKACGGSDGDSEGSRQPRRPDRIRALVEAVGCRLVFLAAYSPDLPAIEEAFTELETLIRAANARTRAALDAAIAVALASVTAADAAGCFTHAGYPTRRAA